MALVIVSVQKEGIGTVKRFASILTIAIVILAITAGPAFAAVCAGAQCAPMMVCATSSTPSCPMKSDAPTARSSCAHPMEKATGDAVQSKAGFEHAPAVVPARGIVVRPATSGRVATHSVADARGAPHMTSVIRI